MTGKRLVRKLRPKTSSPLRDKAATKPLRKRMEDENSGGEERPKMVKKKKLRPPGAKPRSRSRSAERPSSVRGSDGKIKRKKKTKLGAGTEDLKDVLPGGASSQLDDGSKDSRPKKPLRRNQSDAVALRRMREATQEPSRKPSRNASVGLRPKLLRSPSDPSFRISKTGEGLLQGASSGNSKLKTSKTLKPKKEISHNSASVLDYPSTSSRGKPTHNSASCLEYPPSSSRLKRADLQSHIPSTPTGKKSTVTRKVREPTSGIASELHHEQREASRAGRPIRRIKSSSAAKVMQGFSDLEKMQTGIHKSHRKESPMEDDISPRMKRHDDEKVKKLTEKLEEEQQKNELLKMAMAKLKKELLEAKSSQEELDRKMRQERRDNERTMKAKNKEIAELSETVDRILEKERADSSFHTASEKEEALEKAQKELEMFKASGAQSSAELQAAQANWQRERDDLNQKVKERDETIQHLLEQLKDLKVSDSKKKEPAKNENSGWWSLQSSPGTLKKNRSSRAERLAARKEDT